jgi:acetolactate synthase-1/2/3 large subunit
MLGADRFQEFDFGEIDKALAVEDGPVIVNVRINGNVEPPVGSEIAQHLEMTD